MSGSLYARLANTQYLRNETSLSLAFHERLHRRLFVPRLNFADASKQRQIR